jgi:SPP1 gp7 family putative phage head morphogenesis protein
MAARERGKARGAVASGGTSLKELKPVHIDKSDFDKIEAKLKSVFAEVLYKPTIKALQLPPSTIQNAPTSALVRALASGVVTYSRGVFSGRFTAAVSKELRALGAKWDRKEKAYRLQSASLPEAVWVAVGTSEERFKERLERVDRVLAQNLPAKIAGRLKLGRLFDSTIWKSDRQLRGTLPTLLPALSDAQREQIAADWSENMELWVKNFAEDEIKRLRQQVMASVFTGNRIGSLAKTIEASYGVTSRKAKFLARQETNLLLSKLKETRYAEAGVKKYVWRCVAGSPKHPVRPAHKALNGNVFEFANPPVTTEPGEPERRNNPGEDFNCRCFAVPVVTAKD